MPIMIMAKAINMRCMGFCGVDDSVSAKLLQIVSLHYPWVEWGVLFRPDLTGTARYPTEQWIEELCQLQQSSGGKMQLAGHLCGERCQEILNGNFNFVREMAKKGFKRFQVNATAANNVHVDSAIHQQYIQNVKLCIAEVQEVEWIIQCNTETSFLWNALVEQPMPNMSMLYDASCGKGVLVTSFPSPSIYPTIRCGYAGGIGPSTIRQVMTAVNDVAADSASPVWIDMESSLRTIVKNSNGSNSDVFSVEKCFQCIEIGVEFGLPTL